MRVNKSRNDNGPLRQAKRIIVGVVGVTVLILGLVMMVTPGPGIPVILGGLALLSTEFVWAGLLLKKAKKKLKNAGKMVKEAVGAKDSPGAKSPEAEAPKPNSSADVPAAQPPSKAGTDAGLPVDGPGAPKEKDLFAPRAASAENTPRS